METRIRDVDATALPDFLVGNRRITRLDGAVQEKGKIVQNALLEFLENHHLLFS
jgi:hypothetical protein